MKGLVYYGKDDIRYDASHPEPQLKSPKDVKIKVAYCGICGSDLHEYLGGPKFFEGNRNEISDIPKKKQCMGHEMSGQVVEIGPEVKSVKFGDKVAVEATGTCMDRYRFPKSPNYKKEPCPSCAEGLYNCCNNIGFNGLGFDDGGFAEYCVFGESHAVPYPGDVIPDDVAALIEPIAVAWHAVRASGAKTGGSALILGAGPIGLATILSLKGNQVDNIVVLEPSKARRELAEKFNVDTYDSTNVSAEQSAEELKKYTKGGLGFSQSYNCSGVPATFPISFMALKTNGVGINVAMWPRIPLEFFPMDVTLREKFLTGSMSYTRRDFDEVIEAFKQGRIHPEEVRTLITQVASLERGVEDGFKELINNKGKHIKVLISASAH